jgi:hypothetical protein
MTVLVPPFLERQWGQTLITRASLGVVAGTQPNAADVE